MKQFAGLWHIYEMETWDEEYFNMAVQAFVEINENGTGEFQFGLVQGDIDGDLTAVNDGERFEFTWDGADEMDPVSGRGWVKLIDPDTIEGYIKFHQGDDSMFYARKA
ncbi:MAG: hypothetical protein KDE53_34155 [Caldilineaceae bacterium]|nr:hypothetical protein [Caldilineaceae bacterium]